MSITLKRLLQVIFCFFLVIILDIIWFSFVGPIYDAAYEPMVQAFNIDLTSNLLIASTSVYFFIALIITFFLLPQILPSLDYTLAFLWSGFLGFLIYGIYDLTNYILFKDWPLRIAIMDMCWGFFLFGLTTIITRALSTLIKEK